MENHASSFQQNLFSILKNIVKTLELLYKSGEHIGCGKVKINSVNMWCIIVSMSYTIFLWSWIGPLRFTNAVAFDLTECSYPAVSVCKHRQRCSFQIIVMDKANCVVPYRRRKILWEDFCFEKFWVPSDTWLVIQADRWRLL